MRYHCQRAIHRVTDPSRFSPSWTERARTHPDAVVSTVDEAVEWLESTVGEMVSSLTKVQFIRSGYDPDRFERMSDGWRAALERGDMTGTVVGAGDGYVMHAHVFPLQAATG